MGFRFCRWLREFFHFFRGKREMTLNTEYVKSMQGILKILEFVSTSDLELYNVSRGLNVINDPKCEKLLRVITSEALNVLTSCYRHQ